MNNLKKKQQSVTHWTNLLIAGIILTVIIIIALSNILENPESRQIRQLAEKKLRLFARGYSLDAIDCQGIDNNNNGWLNCRADDRKGQTVFLECPYRGEAQECRYK
ncbi:MAG: hypothetical protein QNJ64_03755 [Crocosphaera sp.]|nr:hypothetical protein [Crocosphaera sp.]